VRKPKGRLDTILAGFRDIGKTGGQFGEDIKPLIESLEEINKIVRSHTKGYENLPAPEDRKNLPAPKSEEE